MKERKPKKRKCHHCGERYLAYDSMQKWCSSDCGYHISQKALANKKEKERKEAKKLNKQQKKEVLTRSEWYAKLQVEVNKYVRLRDKDEPCCTCGTTNNIKYDAGHYRSRGACPELRFELTNIHKQCSKRCNVHGSGMRLEYQEFIRGKYGQEHLDWLNGSHKPLKDVFPHWTDIEREILRYRKLNREMLNNE